MRSRYNVILNGVPLSSINQNIVITDVSNVVPTFRRYTATLANRSGLWAGNDATMTAAGVSVTFMIREYSTARRQEICQAVSAWAINGGILQVRERPGQILHCRCDTLPNIDSVRDWTNEISIEFSGYEYPFWMEEYPVTLTLGGTSGNGEIYIPGNAGNTDVEATVTLLNAVQSLTMNVGDTFITLNGIGGISGDKIILSHDENGLLIIKKNETSILNKRTGESDDDLIAVCGQSTPISFQASHSVSIAFSARGVWL